MASTAEMLLQEGTLFNSANEAKACVVKYNVDNFSNFVITNNNKKSLVYGCRHAVPTRKSHCGGKRPNQHYNYLGCEASIRMYKLKDGKVKITKVDLLHKNHVTNETNYRFNNDSLNEEERDLVITLKEANTKTSQIKRILCDRTNKRMSTQRMRNLISKLMSEPSPNDEVLEDYLETMESAGGTLSLRTILMDALIRSSYHPHK